MIFRHTPQPPWSLSHAQAPTPLLLDDCIRVYFSTRDAENRSHIGYVDLDRHEPTKVISVAESPCLAPGELGAFDDSGVMASCALRVGDEIWLYYTGWMRSAPTPYRNTIGLAISCDGGRSFDRHSRAPLFERTPEEPFFFVMPWVLRDGDIWHMWYGCITEWRLVEGKPEPRYHVKYAHSRDGIHWQRDNVSCLAPLTPDEVNVRGSVVKEGGLFRMWYCVRNVSDYRDGAGSYRIAYAESADGKAWERREAQIPRSGFDTKMQAYPAILSSPRKRGSRASRGMPEIPAQGGDDLNHPLCLLYNGDGFGVDGFGGTLIA